MTAGHNTTHHFTLSGGDWPSRGPDTNMNPSNPNKAILKQQTGAPETDNKCLLLLLLPTVQLVFHQVKWDQRVWSCERTELYDDNKAPRGCENTPLYSEQSFSLPAAQHRLMLRHKRCILRYHPELLSLLEFADNWHIETTMNKPFLPILHIFTLSLMLFVLTLTPGLRRAAEQGDWQPAECRAHQLMEGLTAA